MVRPGLRRLAPIPGASRLITKSRLCCGGTRFDGAATFSRASGYASAPTPAGFGQEARIKSSVINDLLRPGYLSTLEE